MKILGFEIRTRSAALAEKRSFYDSIAAWRQINNFTGISGGRAFANPWEAMGVPAVYACVDKIAKTTATLPKQVFDVSDPERPVRQWQSVAGDVLGAKPNGYQTAYHFWHLALARKLLWGNFYAEIQRDARTDEVIGLWPLLTQDCMPELQAGKKTYRVAGKTLADEDIFHIMSPGFDGLQGISVIAMHRAAISTSVEMQRFTEGFYANGTKLSGALEHPGELSTEASERLRDNWTQVYAGGENAGKVAILEEGMKFNPFTMPLGDAEFVATNRLQIAQVARIFDMPLHKLAEMDGAKYNNVEQGNIAWKIDCIEPHNEQTIQELNAKVFAPMDRGRLEVRIPTDELVQGDMQSRMTALGTARQWGLMTINEARVLLGLPSIGAEGDKLFQPGNANAAAPAKPDPAADSKPKDPQTEE
jgi:HK97 family phage portal protein